MALLSNWLWKNFLLPEILIDFIDLRLSSTILNVLWEKIGEKTENWSTFFFKNRNKEK